MKNFLVHVLMVLGAIVLLFGFGAACNAADFKYEVTRIEDEIRFEVTRIELPPPQKQEQKKPVLIFHGSLTTCAPCKAGHDALFAKGTFENLPFEIEYRDRKDWEYPHPIPAFFWSSPSGTMSIEGWYGVDHLVNEFKRTTQVVAVKPTKPEFPKETPLNHNYQKYNVSGMDYAAHVRWHGIDTRGLTFAELEKAHAAIHSGRWTAAQINAYIAKERIRQGR